MRVLAIIITYYPERDLLIENVNAIYDRVDRLLIWENTPTSERLDYRFLTKSKIEYCGDSINSISHALNYAWRYAHDNGYDFLLTMDQDSVFKNFDQYLKTVLEFQSHNECLMGPMISRYSETTPSSIISEIGNNSHLITSGMLIPVSLLCEIKGFCEDFRIEAVDVDLCVRVRNAGRKIYLNSNGVLVQRFGAPYEKKLFGKRFVGSDYNEKRLYEIFRNHIIIYRRYKNNAVKGFVISYFRNFVPRIILWEDNKINKLLAIFKGIIAGYRFKV